MPHQCLNGCECHYDVAASRYVFDCSSPSRTAFPDEVQVGANWLVLQRTNITALNDYKHYMKQIKGLDLSGSNLKLVEKSFLEKLYADKVTKTLRLDHTQIETLPEYISEYRLFAFDALYIGHNQYKCTCDMQWMQHWLIDVSTNSSLNYIKDYKDAVCRRGIKAVRGKPILEVDGGLMGCSLTWYVIAGLVAAGLVGITVLLLLHRNFEALRFLMFLKFNILTGEDDDKEHLEDFDFDLFVSHR